MVAVSTVLVAALVPLLAAAKPIQSDRSQGSLDAREAADAGVNAGFHSARAHIRSNSKHRRNGGRCAPRPESESPNQDSSHSSPDATGSGGPPPEPATTSAASQGGQSSSATPPESAVTSATSQVVQSSAGTASQAAPSGMPPQPSDASTQNGSGNNGGNNGGSLTAGSDGECGANGITDELPNGSEDWINCGLNSVGWNPPHVTVDQLKSVALDGSGVFAPCAPYFDKFNSLGGQYGVPPIMLASFALQESTCNPDASGGNGESGMMQLGSENCAGAPGGNCKDIDFNIGQGAKYFHDKLQENAGNVFLAIGQYNGWYKGLTTDKATQAARDGNCLAQNNLDYIFQMVNGWILNKDGRALGSIHNLDNCK